MASGGFFRGTSVDQDSRYFNQNKKLLAKLSFPPCFDQKVDLAKVKREVIGQWITERVTQLLGFEDDIVSSMIINLLEPKVDERLDPRQLQLTITGFLEKDAPLFMKELWELLLSAQAHPTGIPPVILEKKKQEMAQAAQDKQHLRSVLDRKREDVRDGAHNSTQQQGSKTYGLTSRKPARESHYGGSGGGGGADAEAGPRRGRDRSAPRPSRRRSPSPPPRDRRRHRSLSRSRSRSRSRSSSRSPSRSRSRGRGGRRGRASEPRRRSRSDSRGRSRKSRARRSPSSSPERRPSRKDRGGRRSPSPRKKRDQRSPSRSLSPDQFGRNRRRTLSTSRSRSNSRSRRSRSRSYLPGPDLTFLAALFILQNDGWVDKNMLRRLKGDEEKPLDVSGSGDPELEEFLRKEAEEAEQRKLKRRNKTKDEDDRLFMQYSWTEQRKAGTSAPVLRQVEGDSINHRIRVYRRTIFFHIHAKLEHNAYLLHQLRINNQDPNGKDEKGRTALHYACRHGAETAVRTLIHEEATIDDADLDMRWTPLHFAVMGGHDRIADKLLEKAPVRRITINRKDKHGMTPLMLACGEDHAAVAKLLLRRKAFIDETDDDGWTALHYAAVNDSALAAEVLVQFDCNLKSRTYSTNETALDMAERLRSHLVAILLYEVMYRKS